MHRDIFWFFLQEEEFVSKTINEGSVDLDKFPASKVCQLAKKYESSKVTARHIKQVAGEMEATQIHLMRNQCAEPSNGKYKKQKSQIKQRPMENKNPEQKQPSYHRKSFDPRNAHMQKDRCSKCGDSTHLEGFTCHAKRYQCKSCHKFGHFTSSCFMKGQQKQAYHKPCKPRANQLLQVQSKHMRANRIQKAQTTPSVSSYRSNVSKHRTRLTRNQHA